MDHRFQALQAAGLSLSSSWDSYSSYQEWSTAVVVAKYVWRLHSRFPTLALIPLRCLTFRTLDRICMHLADRQGKSKMQIWISCRDMCEQYGRKQIPNFRPDGKKTPSELSAHAQSYCAKVIGRQAFPVYSSPKYTSGQGSNIPGQPGFSIRVVSTGALSFRPGPFKPCKL